jgi:thioredoxin-like negative regulator of GroEL
MAKQLLTVLLVVTVLALSGCQSKGQPESTNTLASTSSTQVSEYQDTLRIVDYSPAIFEQLGHRRRILFFNATWCTTCQDANTDFEQRTAELPADVTLFRVNYDQETELKNRYGVTYQHTFVIVDQQAKPLKIWNGGGTEKLLQQLAS